MMFKKIDNLLLKYNLNKIRIHHDRVPRCLIELFDGWPLPLSLSLLLPSLKAETNPGLRLDVALGVLCLFCIKGAISTALCSLLGLIEYPSRSIKYDVAPPNTNTVNTIDADVMALSSGFNRVPCPVVVS